MNGSAASAATKTNYPSQANIATVVRISSVEDAPTVLGTPGSASRITSLLLRTTGMIQRWNVIIQEKGSAVQTPMAPAKLIRAYQKTMIRIFGKRGENGDTTSGGTISHRTYMMWLFLNTSSSVSVTYIIKA